MSEGARWAPQEVLLVRFDRPGLAKVRDARAGCRYLRPID